MSNMVEVYTHLSVGITQGLAKASHLHVGSTLPREPPIHCMSKIDVPNLVTFLSAPTSSQI